MISRVLAAVQSLGSRSPTGRVDLVDLREALRPMGRSCQDSALITLHHQRRLVLSREDNTVSKRAAASAVYVGGCPRHLVEVRP